MEIPPGAEPISFLGVDYIRLKTADGGDLFLTRFGLPFARHLAPENWHEPHWFAEKRIRLVGTSTIYRVPTRRLHGVSLNLVVRYSRVGQELPLDPRTIQENPDSEFNSPFEEFALVMELRAAHSSAIGPRVFTKKPLAIYVPGPQLQLWQTGRLESKMAVKQVRHPEVALEIRREYILLYGWIKGLNAVEASRAYGITGTASEKLLAETTLRVIEDLRHRGFRVLDMKPEHVVFRLCHDGSLLRQRNRNLAYALVDYELLERLNAGHRDRKSVV